MSRTLRAKRPRFYLYQRDKRMRGFVRDGAPQYIAPSCAHHNACSYCRDNRTHAHLRRAPLVET